MSDPNQEFHAPPPPSIQVEPERKRPTNLMWAGVALVVLGIIVVIVGIVGMITGGIGTGLSLCALGVLLFALSFARLPNVPDAPAPMSALERIGGIFYEPTNVFRNLRAHPHWLGAILIIGILNAAYVTVFVRRLTPDRIVNFTMDKLEESPIKPPPERMGAVRQQALDEAKSPSFQAGAVVRRIAGTFFFMSFVAAIYLLGVMAFGGRMHFWQALSAAVFAALPVVVIQKAISFIILFVKSPDDIHPLIGQESLVYDNLGLLFSSKDHPVLYVAATAIGILSFYKLWLTAKGLHLTAYKASSSAGWGVAITLWVIGLLFGLAIAAIFPSFLG